MYQNFSKIYDSFMSHCEYDKWTNEIYKIFNKYGKNSGKLLDVGCGTGEMLKIFVDKFECSGLDLSEEMLKITHKKLKSKGLSLFQGDMTNFDTHTKYDVIVSLFDTVNHLISNEELLSHLCSIKRNLADDGVYVFDVVDRNFMNEMFPGGTFVDNRKDMTVIWEHSLEEGIDLIDATYFVKNKNGTFDKLEEFYEKKIFEPNEIEQAINSAGLKLLEVSPNEELAGRRFFYVVGNK